jgi:hypothetical protein
MPGGRDVRFAVATHNRTAPVFSPRVLTLDDPALWQDPETCIYYLECFLGIVQRAGPPVTCAADNLDTNVVCLLETMRTLSGVRPVCIKFFRPAGLGAPLRNKGCSGLPALYARNRYRERYEQSHCIDDEVAFSPLDIYARTPQRR